MTTPRHGRGHGPRLPRLLRAGPFKVQFQNQPNNYMEVLQNIVRQVASICVDALQMASEVSFQGTVSGGDPYHGV